MWELLLALNLVQRHMQRTFEPDSLVRPIQRVRSERDEAAGASAPAARRLDSGRSPSDVMPRSRPRLVMSIRDAPAGVRSSYPSRRWRTM